MKMIKALFASAVMATALVAQLNAQTVTIALPDIGTFGGYTDGNTSDTFTGNGFLGIYPNDGQDNGGPAFAHLFGLENYGGIYSETELQASLSGLAGDTITSASLNFSLNNGSGGAESVEVTSFSTAGTLGYSESAPNDLASLTANGITLGANSIDVTTLVADAVAANQSYVGLYLSPDGPSSSLWTYTYSGFGYNADSASADLVINYTPAAAVGVPDASSTAALLGIVVSGLGLARRKLNAV
jgi:hypothetical protein